MMLSAVVVKLIADDENLDEVTLKIMEIAYSTGGGYSNESLLTYAKTYFDNTVQRIVTLI